MVERSTIAQCLAFSKELGNRSDSPRLDVELLLAHVLKKSRAHLYAFSESVLEPKQLENFQALLARRNIGEPIAYILGTQGFWSLDLEVNNTTLIPRPDTELLVELALDRCVEQAHILDLGTGTGAIAIALAKELPEAKVDAVDLSDDIVQLAKRNCDANETTNVRVFQSDWFEHIHEPYDLIVANPPYIEQGDAHLSDGDVRFEPKTALVSGPDGLTAIRHICQHAVRFLNESGWLITEHGWKQSDAVRRLFLSSGFRSVDTFKDYGGNDRVTLGQLY